MNNMKNTIIGFLAGIVLILTIGHTSKKHEYEVTTKFSIDERGKSNWGDNVKLHKNRADVQANKKAETDLKEMYAQGWRVVHCEKYNKGEEQSSWSWVFERMK